MTKTSLTESMYEKRMKMIEEDPELSDLTDYAWDIVICPKCADTMFRHETVIDLPDDNGQHREFECCPKCMKQVVTMYNFGADQHEKYKLEEDNYEDILHIYVKSGDDELREW